MSEQYLNPFMSQSLASARSWGTMFGGAGGGGGSPMYQELDRTTLTGNGDSVDVSGFSAVDQLMILWTCQCSGTCSNKFTLNGSTGSEYSRRDSGNGGSGGTNVSEQNWALNYTSDDNYRFGFIFLDNDLDSQKLGYNYTVQSTGSGFNDVPNRTTAFLGWEESTEQITQVTMTNDKTGDYTSGTEVIVLGANTDDTGDSVWEELASQEITSAGDPIEVSGFTAKDYLWVQVYNVDNGTGDLEMKLNNAGSSNYAERYSDDFGSDSTNGDMGGMSGNYGALQGNSLNNYFMINKSGLQKLTYYTYAIEGGSASTHPKTMECASNCIITDQTTEIDITVGGGNFGSGSWIKVWGF
jgi:hypothetical protein